MTVSLSRQFLTCPLWDAHSADIPSHRKLPPLAQDDPDSPQLAKSKRISILPQIAVLQKLHIQTKDRRQFTFTPFKLQYKAQDSLEG